MKVKLSSDAVQGSGWQKLVQSSSLFSKQKGLPARTVLPATLGLIAVVAGLVWLQSGSFVPVIFVAVCGGIPLYAAMFVFGAYLWRNTFDRTMDLPVVFITADTLQRGQHFELDYSQHFKKDTQIETMKVQLILREWVRYTAGTSTSTDSRDIVITEDWLDNVPISANSDFIHTFNMKVPDTAMHTFAATDNKISWHIAVDMDLPGWLDFRDRYDITVTAQVDTPDDASQEATA